jgi:hypothetical protein
VASTGAGGVPENLTVVRGRLSGGLNAKAGGAATGTADTHADAIGPKSIELGDRDDAVRGTPDADTFVHRAGAGGTKTILDFDPAADRLVILGAPAVSVLFDRTAGRAEVRMSDGGTIVLHVTR